MRKPTGVLVCLVLLLAVVIPNAGAQNLTDLGTDMSTLLSGIGESVLPNMQQNLLAGQGIGAATMGASKFYVGLEGGVTFGSPGLLAVLTQSPTPFKLIDASGLIGNLSSSSTLNNYLQTAENLSYFPYPDGKLLVGVQPLHGLEIIGTFWTVPQAVTNLLTRAIGQGASGIELNTLSASVRVRKTLLEDKGGFPAISIGAGYGYARFHTAYGLPTQTQPFSTYTLTYGGQITIDSTLNTAGVDLSVSKRLLIFTPYLQVSPWYEWASFTGTIPNFASNVTLTPTPSSGYVPPAQPNATITINDLSILLSGGVEINLGGFSLVPAGSFDLATKNLSANIASRVQF